MKDAKDKFIKRIDIVLSMKRKGKVPVGLILRICGVVMMVAGIIMMRLPVTDKKWIGGVVFGSGFAITSVGEGLK